MSSVFISIIIMLFPFACYFIYLTYSKIIQNEKTIFLDLAIFTSFYLSTRVFKMPIYLSFLINFPFIISIYKKRYLVASILVLLNSLYFTRLFGVNIIIFIIGYIFMIAISLFVKRGKIIIFSIISSIVILYIIFVDQNSYISFDNLNIIILFLIIMYLFNQIFVFFFNKLRSTHNIYETLDNITKEKRLYESLFKITHEIKNPLAVCKGYLDMMDLNNRPKANKYIGIINEEVNKSLILLEDFANISKLKIEKSNMDINLLLLDISDEIKIIFNNVKFISEVPLYDEVYIYGDYDRLKQVFVNIIKNAKEACNKNGIVKLWTENKKNKIIINVLDNGVGITKENFKDVGKPFFTTKKNGTGLGICLSKEIIEKHNGNIEFIPNNNGTLVKISLPKNKSSN